MSGRFRCPECGERFAGAAWTRHLAERTEERAALFARFVADHPDARLPTEDCTGSLEILPLMDEAERERFGATVAQCGPDVMRCGCTGSFCLQHSFLCDTCGRFACLRHRWSGTCPDCVRANRPRPVKVDKYDPFSKQRSSMIRTYRRSGGVAVWDAVVDPTA